MIRVHVVVEGATEEAFIKNLLAETLWHRQIHLTPILLGVAGHKGGSPSYTRLKHDVGMLLKQEKATYCTTMLDLYGLRSDFPGMPLPAHLSGMGKVRRLEQLMHADICRQIPDVRADDRFLPYIQPHEYEALLFSDPAALARALNTKLAGLQAIRTGYPTPEDINDSTDTAPSKQLARLVSSYNKVIDGTLSAGAVGIDAMRRECPHFREWLERLEDLRAI